MKLGIVGLGHVWEWQKKALELSRDIDVVALCDTNQSKLDNESLCVTKVLDYRAIGKDLVDCVLISTPPDTHFEICKFYLEMEINIIVEKPVVLNEDELEELAGLQRNSLFITAFHAAYAEDLNWFMNNSKHIEGIEQEKLVEILCEFYDPYVKEGKVADKAKVLGGSWIDSGINALSVVSRIVEGSDVKFIERVSGSVCDEVVDTWSVNYFLYRLDDYSEEVQVVIKTNWENGLNHKSSLLTYSKGTQMYLNHSEQRVELIVGHHRTCLFEDGSMVRLVRHYVNLFDDVMEMYELGLDNLGDSLKVHGWYFFVRSRE